MKISEANKAKAAAYVASLRLQIEAEIGCKLGPKILEPLRQAYQFVLQRDDRAVALERLRKEADELGYCLLPKPKPVTGWGDPNIPAMAAGRVHLAYCRGLRSSLEMLSATSGGGRKNFG